MMLKAIFGCSLAFVTLATSAMWAQTDPQISTDYNAETMLSFCEGDVPDATPEVQSLICTFRIQGVAEVMSRNCLTSTQGFQPHPAFTAMPPRSRGAMRQAFKNYMRENPHVWDARWAIAVMAALSEAFPCDLTNN